MAKAIKIDDEFYINVDQVSHFYLNENVILFMMGNQHEFYIMCKPESHFNGCVMVSIQEFHRIKRELCKYMEITID